MVDSFSVVALKLTGFVGSFQPAAVTGCLGVAFNVSASSLLLCTTQLGFQVNVQFLNFASTSTFPKSYPIIELPETLGKEMKVNVWSGI